MNNVWSSINGTIVGLGLLAGYRWLAPENLKNTNPGPALCGIMILLMPIFCLGTVYYAKLRWDREDKKIFGRAFRLRRPSWNRNPFHWRGDPLQSLFVSTCYTAGMSAGAALRYPTSGSAAFWMLGTFCSSAVGLLAGTLLAHRVFRPYLVGA